MNKEKNIIELQHVRKCYEKDTTVIEDFSLEIKKGEFVGYGATYRARNDEYIATLPIGYADGIDLRNLGRYVYINSKPYEIIGSVCMGMISIRVDESVKLGDVVEIINEKINAQDIAKHTVQTTYSVITNISYELPRVYIER